LRADSYGRSTLSAASVTLGGQARSNISGRRRVFMRAWRQNTKFLSLYGGDAVSSSTHRIGYAELTALIAVIN